MSTQLPSAASPGTENGAGHTSAGFPSHRFRRAIFVVVLGLLFVWLRRVLPEITALRANPPDECQPIPHLDWTPALFAAGAGYVASGVVAGLVRTRRQRAIVAQSANDGGRGWNSPKALGYLALWTFLANLIILLGYETYAVATDGVATDGPWPITWYVRCANANVERQAAIALGAFCVAFMISHWFWYPLRWFADRSTSADFQVRPFATALVGILAGLGLAAILVLSTPGGFRVVLAIVLLGWLFLSAAAEILSWRNSDLNSGSRLHAWSGQYPLFAAAVALLFGALIGHFF